MNRVNPMSLLFALTLIIAMGAYALLSPAGLPVNNTGVTQLIRNH